MNRCYLQFGAQKIEYELVYAPRTTLAITVHPDLSVTVKAPEGVEMGQVEQRVYNRGGWILKQQRQYERYLPDVPPRQYLSGESYRYLGRQVRLKVIEVLSDETEKVEITRHMLNVSSHEKSPEHVRPLVEGWVAAQAQAVFTGRLNACYPKVARFDVPYPDISIRRMKASWGSCSAKGLISLNIKLIQAPKEYIDYVILHELCHLKEHHHGPQFQQLLTRVMPDWKEKKQRLDVYDFG